ncbi:MAG: DNA-binding protein [Bacteroidia bacterium]|nr:DNA-binding protein [Bacteroidia bacterium]
MNFRYIADANVLMSILISGKAQYVNMLSLFNFIMPEFAFVELNLYKEVICKKTKLDKNQFRQYAYTVFSLISFVPSFIQQDSSIERATKFCKKVDIKDLSYVTLSIDTDLFLLTRDIKLYKGLRKQGYRKIELFENFLKKL